MRSVPPLVFVSLLGSVACAPAGSSAYVSANVPLSAECVPGDGTTALSTGTWDVLANGTKKTSCNKAYHMALVINSNLQANSDVGLGRAEPNALLVTYADIRLMDKDEGTLGFKAKDGSADSARPNPYRVHTAASIPPTKDENPSKGWVELDAIPAGYAAGLRGYDGDSILLEIQLFGKTTGDVTVDFQRFTFPLAICSDCRSTCKNDAQWLATPGKLEDLNADHCGDNRGQDERTCVDPEC